MKLIRRGEKQSAGGSRYGEVIAGHDQRAVTRNVFDAVGRGRETR